MQLTPSNGPTPLRPLPRSGALCVLLALSLSIAACGGDKGDAAKEGDGGAKKLNPIAVAAQPVQTKRFTQTLTYPGVAQPVETRRIAAESSGRVLAAPFDEGDTVKKGELLLRVDAKTTNAQLNLLKSQVSSAKREYNRITQLAAEGLATPQQLDQARSQLDQARLGVKQVEVGRGMSVVRSPFTGVVSQRFLKKGEFAAPGQPILELIDYTTIKLEVTIPESSIQYIKLGEMVDVRFSAIDKMVKGKVVRQGVMVTQPTQTFPVEVEIPNEDLLLRPGMRADVVLPKLSLEDAVVVPRDALLEGVYRREAMVVTDIKDSLGKAELRVVEIGESKGNEVVITSGLQKGDMLIRKGHRNVVDGTLVRLIGGVDDIQKDDAPEPSKETQKTPTQPK